MNFFVLTIKTNCCISIFPPFFVSRFSSLTYTTHIFRQCSWKIIATCWCIFQLQEQPIASFHLCFRCMNKHDKKNWHCLRCCVQHVTCYFYRALVVEWMPTEGLTLRGVPIFIQVSWRHSVWRPHLRALQSRAVAHSSSHHPSKSDTTDTRCLTFIVPNRCIILVLCQWGCYFWQLQVALENRVISRDILVGELRLIESERDKCVMLCTDCK